MTMLSCSEISKLVSESLEEKLPWRKRMAVGVHHLMCRFCFGFARHTQLLRRAVRDHPERLEPETNSEDAKLSAEARERIKCALCANPNQGDSSDKGPKSS